MMRIKRIILRVSVFLLLFLLVATVLSRTVYRLLLPQVSVAAVHPGTLNNAAVFSSSIGLPLADTDAAEGLKYAADVRVSFDELNKILSPAYKYTASAQLVSQTEAASVDIAFLAYDYDGTSSRFIAHFAVSGKDKAIEPGLPLAITVKPADSEQKLLVPLNAVFPDYSSGGPQYCVYGLSERQTMWGKETYVYKVSVTVEGSDYQSTAIVITGGELVKQVVCYPTRPLNDGDAVTVLKVS